MIIPGVTQLCPQCCTAGNKDINRRPDTPPLPPSPPQHENVRQFLFKTCSVKSVVEKGPIYNIYNSGLDSHFYKVRHPARSDFFLSEILIPRTASFMCLLSPSCCSLIKFYQTKNRATVYFLKRKIFRSQTKLKGKKNGKY